MSEIHTHVIDDHHVTRCLHDHTHGKNPLGDMGMKFEVPESTLQKLTLEKRLEMLLADLKDRTIGKSCRGFGTGGNSLADSSGQGNGSSVLLTPLAETVSEQGKTQGQVSPHTLVPLLPAPSQERKPLPRSSDGTTGQESTSVRQNTTLSSNDDNNRRQTHAPSAKTRKKRLVGWIFTDADDVEIEDSHVIRDLPVSPLPTFLYGNYDAQGFLSQRVRNTGAVMDRRG